METPPPEKTLVTEIPKEFSDAEKTAITDAKALLAQGSQKAQSGLWAAFKAVLGWCKDHLGIIATVIGAAVLYSVTLGKRGVSPAEKLAVELDAVDAKSQAATIAAQQGADAAHEHIQTTYQAQIQALNTEQLREATALKDDPGSLASYLVRIGSQLSKNSPQ